MSATCAELSGHRVDVAYGESYASRAAEWSEQAGALTAATDDVPPTQAQIIGAVNRHSGPQDVVVCAAGSLPNDLHKVWRNRDPKGYHVEYGYSCMGYEIAGGIGIRLADPSRRVYVMVGDGSYLMMPSELVTCVQENISIVVIIVDNGGFASVGALAKRLGSEGVGTLYRYADDDAQPLPVDLAANAASLGAHVLRARTVAEFEVALQSSDDIAGPVVIHVETRYDDVIPRSAWWDVHVAEVAETDGARSARTDYEANVVRQRRFL